jgi:hypothetical protein
VSAAFAGQRQGQRAIASELLWLDALGRETNLTLQRPAPSLIGRLVIKVESADERIPCWLLTWVEGRPFPRRPSATVAATLGALIARLHQQARLDAASGFRTSDLRRRLLSASDHRVASSRSGGNCRRRGSGRDRTGAWAHGRALEEIAPTEDDGDGRTLIHADLHRGNLPVHQGAVSAWLAERSPRFARYERRRFLADTPLLTSRVPAGVSKITVCREPASAHARLLQVGLKGMKGRRDEDEYAHGDHSRRMRRAARLL